MNDLLTNPFVRHIVWRSLILPGLATLAASLILLALTRNVRERDTGSLWSIPLLIGLLSGYFAVYHDWSLWPRTILGWLPALAIVTAMLAGWTAHRSRWLGRIAVALLVIGTSGIMLQPLLQQGATIPVLREWAVIALVWWLLWRVSAGGRGDQRGAAASQIILAAGLATAGPFSQSILLGQLAMVIGATWAVVIALSWLRSDMPISTPAADLGALVLGVLYIELWYYAAAPWRVVLSLLVAAALGAAAHRIYLRVNPTQPLKHILISAAATALPAAVGVYFAWQTYVASGGSY